MLSVGEWNAGLLSRIRRFSTWRHGGVGTRATYMPFAILLSRKALAPIPGAWGTPLVAFPSGAWGTTTCAACFGL